MENAHTPGVAACIFKRGAVVWSAAYGFANLDQRMPMTLDTLQNIGSISKTIATMALMLLWEKGASASTTTSAATCHSRSATRRIPAN